MSTDPRYDAIIVGAGIVGASIGYHLGALGLRTAIFDESGPAAGASGAADGAVSVSSKKPGLMANLATQALSYCMDLARPNGPLNKIFRTRPTYYFSTTEAEDIALDALAVKLAALDGPVGVSADTSGSRSVVQLGSSVRRVMEIFGEGHMLGYGAVNAYLDASRAERHWPCAITGFQASPASVTVETTHGRFKTSHLILAAGLSTQRLLPALPLLARAGQLIVTDRAPVADRLSGALTAASYLLAKTTDGIELPNSPIVIDPLATGQFLIGSSRESHGDPHRTDFATVRRLLIQASQCYAPVAERRIVRVFAGIRAAVSDGIPIVGALHKTPRVIVATGFEGDGICLSSLIGREVAALVTGNSMMAEMSALTPDRFPLNPAKQL